MSYFVYNITANGYNFRKFPTQEEAVEIGAEVFSNIPDEDLDKILLIMRRGEMPQETINNLIEKIRIYSTIDKANRTCTLVEFISTNKNENMLH